MKIVNFICAAVIALFAIGYAFAWFVQDAVTYTPGFGGSSAGAYFKSGSGTESDPYVIANKYHLYNLAWLQNTGKLEGTHYYFELDKELSGSVEMAGMVLPPIGNDEYPFTGVFNGNGKTIADLVVSTNKNVLTNSPLQSGASYEFSRAVGLFGMTGTDAEGTAEISNFILKDPVVEVSDETKTAYIDTAYGSASSEVIGIAVGAVENNVKVSSIGVVGGRLLVRKTGYTTFNSILGSVADNSYAVTGGGYTGTGGSGNSFGASFDVDSLLARLKNIATNKSSDTPSWRLPDIDTSSDNPVVVAGEKIAFTVTENSTYDGASAIEEVASNNVGYFTGNQNKIQTKTLTFTEPMVQADGLWGYQDGTTPESAKAFPNWFYTFGTRDEAGNLTYPTYGYTVTYSDSAFRALTEDEYEGLPDSIKNILVVDENYNPVDLSTATAGKTFQTIRLQAQYWGADQATLSGAASTSDGNVAWAFHGQINWMGNTYGEGYRSADGYAVDGDGNYILTDKDGNYLNYGQNVSYGGYYYGVPLPSNAIWFKPAQAGTIRLVLYSEDMEDAFSLIKCTRDYATEDDPFALEWAENVNTNGWNTKYASLEYIFMHYLPSRVLFYYEYEITEDDLVNGTYPEFMLCKGNTSGNGSYFVYLDIGSSNAEDDQNRVDRSKNISAVDFVYDGVTIAQEAEDGAEYSVGDFLYENQLYVASQTSIYFEDLQNLLVIAYARSLSSDASVSFTVSYYSDGGAEELKATVSGKADLVPDEDNYYVSDSTGAIAVWTYG